MKQKEQGVIMKLDGNKAQLGYKLDMEKYAKQVAKYNKLMENR